MQRLSQVISTGSFASFCVFFLVIAAGGCLPSEQIRSERSDSASVLERIEPTVSLEEQVARIAGVYLNEYRQLRIRRSVGPPLIVVDGARMGKRGNLSFINPYDIDQIEVIKGPQTAYYGMGGRDGVILVTTKHGRKVED
ncbi:MAG: TonB-dependent receptor plug domain-containing protein [Rhodothermales bacterium]